MGIVFYCIITCNLLFARYAFSKEYIHFLSSFGKLIQSQSTNHLGGKDAEYIAYNFTGQPTDKIRVHSVEDKEAISEVYAYRYDHAGRLLETKHNLGNKEVLIAKNSYDDLGRLQSNTKGNTDKLKSEFAYNIRSWTQSITSPLFTQNLSCNTGADQPQYGGNISAIKWRVHGDTDRKYEFAYDKLSRLTAANYYSGDQKEYIWSYGYDAHGNILNRKRDDANHTNSYSLNGLGNQMIAQNNDLRQMTYNQNGALTANPYKEITEIRYNFLNLPKAIKIEGEFLEAENEYTYAAGGQKLKVVQKFNPAFNTNPIIGSDINVSALTQSLTTDYVGNKIYENG